MVRAGAREQVGWDERANRAARRRGSVVRRHADSPLARQVRSVRFGMSPRDSPRRDTRPPRLLYHLGG